MKDLPAPQGEILFLDLGKGEVPEKTAGWTDDQILNKSISDFDQMIASAQHVIDQLEKSIADQEKLLRDYKRLKRRREELGG